MLVGTNLGSSNFNPTHWCLDTVRQFHENFLYCHFCPRMRPNCSLVITCILSHDLTAHIAVDSLGSWPDPWSRSWKRSPSVKKVVPMRDIFNFCNTKAFVEIKINIVSWKQNESLVPVQIVQLGVGSRTLRAPISESILIEPAVRLNSWNLHIQFFSCATRTCLYSSALLFMLQDTGKL